MGGRLACRKGRKKNAMGDRKRGGRCIGQFLGKKRREEARRERRDEWKLG
jgi:hypothetical protein